MMNADQNSVANGTHFKQTENDVEIPVFDFSSPCSFAIGFQIGIFIRDSQGKQIGSSQTAMQIKGDSPLHDMVSEVGQRVTKG